MVEIKNNMAPKKTAVESLVGTIKPPISFKEFSKDPVKGLLFIVLIAIGYLYVDIKLSNKEIVTKQEAQILRCETKVDTLQSQIKILIQQASVAEAKYQMLETLKKLPQ